MEEIDAEIRKKIREAYGMITDIVNLNEPAAYTMPKKTHEDLINTLNYLHRALKNMGISRDNWKEKYKDMRNSRDLWIREFKQEVKKNKKKSK